MAYVFLLKKCSTFFVDSQYTEIVDVVGSQIAVRTTCCVVYCSPTSDVWLAQCPGLPSTYWHFLGREANFFGYVYFKCVVIHSQCFVDTTNVDFNKSCSAIFWDNGGIPVIVYPVSEFV